MPLVSFIVPIFNSESFLEKCLNSLLAQSSPDFEVIMVDDGSTDGSRAICERYSSQDKRFVTIHQSNGGVSHARNIGIEHSAGEWITFLDSDDYVEPNFVDLLTNLKASDYIMASYSKFKDEKYYVKESFEENTYTSINQDFFSLDNLKVGFFTAWSKYFRASIIKEHHILFDVDVSSGEDTIFVFKYLYYVSSAYISPQPMYNWRECNGLTNRKRPFKFILYTIDLTINAIEQVEKRHKVNLREIKYNNILYLLDRVDLASITFKDIRDEARILIDKLWMQDLSRDSQILIKGKRRKVLDWMIKRECITLLTIYWKCFNKIYA